METRNGENSGCLDEVKRINNNTSTRHLFENDDLIEVVELL